MRARFADQRGIALPVVLAAMAVVLALVPVIMTQNISATDTAKRDVYSRQALAAAEAGLDLAEYRANAVSLDARSLLNLQSGLGILKSQCVAQVSGALSIIELPTLGEWCPESASESLGNGSSFRYRISPPAALNVTVNPNGDIVRCTNLFPGNLLAATLNCVLGLNTLIYQVTNVDKVLQRRVVSTGMAGPGCPGTGPNCVRRRVTSTYSFRGTSALPIPGTASGLGGLLSGILNLVLGPVTSLLNGGDLELNIRLYGRDAGSFKECTSTAPNSTPSSGC